MLRTRPPGQRDRPTSYGRSTGFCVDPIEKKPLNHFLPGSAVLSFGTAGCNLACRFCQNWDISKSREVDTLADAATPEAIARAAQHLGCAVGGLHLQRPRHLRRVRHRHGRGLPCRGIKAVAVTAGYMNPAPRAEFYRHMDAANVDLKGFTEAFYADLCAGRLAPVLDTLRYLVHETRVWVEITTLLIPGHNDSDAELDCAAAGWSMSSGRTCRCTSGPSTPTTSCSTCRPRRRRP